MTAAMAGQQIQSNIAGGGVATTSFFIVSAFGKQYTIQG